MKMITVKGDNLRKFEVLRDLSKELERINEMINKNLDSNSTEVLKRYRDLLLK